MDAVKLQRCLNCESACKRPNSETFHCPQCGQGLSNREKNCQAMRWVKAASTMRAANVACGQQIDDSWPEGYLPEHLQLHEPASRDLRN